MRLDVSSVAGWLRGMAITTAVVLAGSSAVAAPSTKIGTAPLLSPTAADGYYGGSTTATNSTGAAARPAEVQELARALKGDPDLIYEYVRNNAEIVWSYGLTKGPLGVIVDHAGTAFDQASLMVELLRQSGYTASYKLGTITLSGAQFASWSGVTSATAACQLLSSGGIPAVINGTTTADCSYGAASVSTIEVGHAWVAVTIQGVTYVYDPAFKDHTFTSGLNLATATGMVSGALGNPSAVGGQTSGIYQYGSISTAGMTTALANYTAALDSAVATNLPAGSMADLIGGQTINRQALPPAGLRQLTLPYTVNELHAFDGPLPDQYRTGLRVQITKARPDATTLGIVDKTLYVDEIYGRRLIFDPNFDTSGATFTASLKLVDDLGVANTLAAVSPLADNPTFSRGTVTLSVNMPYAANAGAYMDGVVSRPVTYALPFTIAHGWGDEGRGLIDKWGSRRDAEMPAMPDPTCKVCHINYKAWKGDGRRELLAAEWLAQASRAARLHAAIAHAVFLQHYSVGVVAADTTVLQTANGAFWITDSFDRVDVETGMSLTSTTATAADRRAALFGIASTLSALKGSVVAQVADLPETSSTATRFEWGNAQRDTNGVAPPFYFYGTAADASQTYALTKTQNVTTTTASGLDFATSVTIGSAETLARRQAVADAVSAYVSAGFYVSASSEALLGPGGLGAGLTPSGTQYTHAQTPQRGGALVAVRVDATDMPLEIAHALVNPGSLFDGGGGGAQTYQQAKSDPPTAADVVKGRFVNGKVGEVMAASPAKLAVGQGKFPYQLVGQLKWRDSQVRDQTYEVGAHREPMSGWYTDFNNTLTLSGSGLEAMGETDVREATATVAAFYAAQDIYKTSTYMVRDVLGEFVTAWWTHQLVHNVATVNVGASTRQFVRKADGSWLSPGPHYQGSLSQTNAPTAGAVGIGMDPSCSNRSDGYSPTQSWGYQGVAFQVASGTGDTLNFTAWANGTVDTSTSLCATQQGWRLTDWTWLNGADLKFTYGRSSTASPQIEELTSVRAYPFDNVILNFTGGGRTGIRTGTSKEIPVVTVGGTASQPTHTDRGGAVSRFDIASMGVGDYAQLRLQDAYTADNTSVPAMQYAYDSLARLAQTRDRLTQAGSRSPTQVLLADGVRAEQVDALGNSTVVYADLNGRPYRSIDALGGVSTRTYDGRGRLVSVTDAEGAQTTYLYNSDNLPTQQTRNAKPGSAEAGQTLVTQTGWSGGLVSWTKDAKGAQTDYSYLGGAISSITYPPANPGETRYNSSSLYFTNGLTMSLNTVSGRGISATYSDDALSSLTDTVSAQSGVTNVVPDWFGNPTTLTSPRGGVTNIYYNALNQPSFRADPQVGSGPRTAVNIGYDAVGRPVWGSRGTWDGTTFTPLLTTSAVYDLVGNKVKEVTPSGVTQYSYDALNRVVCTAVRMNRAVYSSLPDDACQASPRGPDGPDRISRVTYDAAGHVVQTETGVGTDLQQVTARYTYSPGGLQTSLTDANGNRSVFEYDGFNRLKRLRYPAAPRGSGQASTTDYEEYSYDANGNMLTRRKRDGQVISYQYDALNRVTVKDLPGTTSGDVYYDYANNGRTVTSRFGAHTIFSGGQPTTNDVDMMTYDEAGRLLVDQTPQGRYTATYDTEGNRTLVDMHTNGKFQAYYAYDLAERMTSVSYHEGANTGTGQQVLTFGYDLLGRRRSITRSNGVTTSYTFDGGGRLAGLAHTTPNVGSASFDQNFGYNAGGQLVSQSQAAAPYIWSGQPTSTVNYTHDNLNRDAAIAAASGYDLNGNLVSDGTRTFTYDPENRLTGVAGGSAAVAMGYDGWGRLSQVTAGSAVTNFIYGGASLLQETTATAPSRFYIDGAADEPLVEGDWVANGTPSTIKFLHQDRLGSVVGVSDAAALITPYTYGPYGEPQNWAGSRFRYTGQIAIPEAQLYHYRARAYDPMMGRFLQSDPTKYADGPNIYAYVHGDPLNHQDPTGLSDWEDDYLDGMLSGPANNTIGRLLTTTIPYDGGYDTCDGHFSGPGEQLVGDCTAHDIGGLPGYAFISWGPFMGGGGARGASQTGRQSAGCSAARTAAGQLSKALDAVSDTAFWLSVGGGAGTITLGVLEVPTAGADTPFTAGAAGFTATMGAISTAASGASAAFGLFASSGDPAFIAKFGVGLLNDKLGSAALHGPVGEELTRLIGKAADLSMEAKTACQ